MNCLAETYQNITGKPFGFLNPFLYKRHREAPMAFRDISLGDNICTEDHCFVSCKGFTRRRGGIRSLVSVYQIIPLCWRIRRRSLMRLLLVVYNLYFKTSSEPVKYGGASCSMLKHSSFKMALEIVKHCFIHSVQVLLARIK